LPAEVLLEARAHHRERENIVAAVQAGSIADRPAPAPRLTPLALPPRPDRRLDGGKETADAEGKLGPGHAQQGAGLKLVDELWDGRDVQHGRSSVPSGAGRSQ